MLAPLLSVFTRLFAYVVRPIIGLEVDLLLPYRLTPPPGAPLTGSLVLLAQDRRGWANLCKLSTRALDGSPF